MVYIKTCKKIIIKNSKTRKNALYIIYILKKVKKIFFTQKVEKMLFCCFFISYPLILLQQHFLK
jgi:hypothetical protein